MRTTMVANRKFGNTEASRTLPIYGLMLLCLAGFAWWPSAGAAQDGATRIFTVYGIEVDVRARTAAEARRQALTDAQEQAFEDLMVRLVADDDLYRVSTPTGADLDSLVRSIEVVRERRSATRYLAKLNIGFDPEGVRQMLGDLDVRYTESRSRPYLVLPVYMRGGAWQLWGGHDWAKAWKEGGFRNHLVTFVFAEGNFDDRVAVSATEVAAAKPSALADMAARLDTEAVLIARARLETDYATARPAVSWSFQSGSANAMSGRGRLVADPEESADDLLKRAAKAIMRRLDAAWKARTVLADDELRWLEVRAPVTKLADWVALRKRLSQVSLVRKVEIARIALPMSQFRIQYVGGVDQLKLALTQSRLTMIGQPPESVVVLSEHEDKFLEERGQREKPEIARNPPVSVNERYSEGDGPDGGRL